MNDIHALNRETKLENERYEKRFNALMDIIQKHEDKHLEYEHELDKYRLYKTETESKAEAEGNKLKNLTRELEVTAHQSRIYEEELTEIKKEYEASQV